VEGKRPEQRGIDQGKDRAVGADAKRQCQSRDQREGRRVLQLAYRELQIVPKFVEPAGDAHFHDSSLWPDTASARQPQL
jgi:hypothetical protein